MSRPEWSPPAAVLVPARQRRPVRVWDLVLTIVLLVLLAGFTALVSFFGFFIAMASDPCGGSVQCSSDLIGLGVITAVAVPWILFLIAVAGSVVLLVFRRIAFWVPLATAPLVVGAWILGAVIAGAGVPT